MIPDLSASFKKLSTTFKGELFYDNSEKHEAQKIIYSTDASVYQEKPLAVAVPKDDDDLKSLISFANQHSVTLIPRTAGTSLAGQVVGNGIVVDVSKYFKKIIEVNVRERWVRLQPGVVRDDLNAYLRPYGLMFGPETSTANRAMVGGMIGNNSCGLHSIVWGDTRQHLIEAKVYLSNGSQTVFKKLSADEVAEKSSMNNLEGVIYKSIADLLSSDENAVEIETGYPKKSLTRRNTGYALDILLNSYQDNNTLNLCELLAGSEGTLAFVTEAKLNLLPLPPKIDGLICIHCSSLAESLHANNIALKHKPMASELVDKYIMDFTKGHPTYHNNRFFIQGDPEAMLMVEFMEDTIEEIKNKADALIQELKDNNLGYAYPLIVGSQTKLVWDIRKAGLGLIRNMPGDTQPVNLIEDCAVFPEDLPAYVEDLKVILNKHKLNASYYAHAGAGELHIEPMINLKTIEGKQLFRQVLAETAQLVKKHNGSLSGEHGDGRLRGEFIGTVLGENVYKLLKEVKQAFDPAGIFNANKIVDTPPMNEDLRYQQEKYPIKPVETLFDFSGQENILRLTEKCSGSGDCRKTHVTGGTMCPSYMATLQEKDTTRARANILRQFLTNSIKENPFDHEEIKEVMDLCLSCKGCKTECPSSVDIAKMKAEFLQHYYDANGVPFRTKIIGNFTKSQKLASIMPGVYNFLIGNGITAPLIKKTLGFAVKRSLPTVAKQTLSDWSKKHANQDKKAYSKRVYLFCDEFTNYNDAEIGKTAILLLNKLGYEVVVPDHVESGRTYLSKGMVREAQKIINKNIKLLDRLITEQTPLVGIEPSAILSFRDEYPDLADRSLIESALKLAKNSFAIEEFILREMEAGFITSKQFSKETKSIKLHGHCYQKAFNIISGVEKILQLPENYQVEQIPSGCCGMAGSFGYEKEKYEVSMKIGDLVLLPAVRAQSADTIIAASGTSCRHQIKDGTGRKACHPVEILYDALI